VAYLSNILICCGINDVDALRKKISADSLDDSCISVRGAYNICAVAIVDNDTGEARYITLEDLSKNSQAAPLRSVCLSPRITGPDNAAVFCSGGNTENPSIVFDAADATYSGRVFGQMNTRVEEMERLNHREAGSENLLNQQPGRCADAEQRALRAVELLANEYPEGKNRTIIIVSRLDACRFCAYSGAGFARRYSRLFRNVEVHYVFSYNADEKLTKDLYRRLNEQQLYTRVQIPNFTR
jgi:hypothetical protein